MGGGRNGPPARRSECACDPPFGWRDRPTEARRKVAAKNGRIARCPHCSSKRSVEFFASSHLGARRSVSPVNSSSSFRSQLPESASEVGRESVRTYEHQREASQPVSELREAHAGQGREWRELRGALQPRGARALENEPARGYQQASEVKSQVENSVSHNRRSSRRTCKNSRRRGRWESSLANPGCCFPSPTVLKMCSTAFLN